MQLTLDGRPIDELAIESLRFYAPKNGEPYDFAYSGGKDATVVLDLLERSGVPFVARNQWIPIEPPELRRFVAMIAKQKPVIIERPSKALITVALEGSRCMMPLRNRRWCCSVFKEERSVGNVVVTGIRRKESNQRKRRSLFEFCNRVKSRAFVHPIIDWNTNHVWDYIHERNLPYCSLYDEGFTRLGCVLCPMTRDSKRQIARWPGIVRVWRKVADAIYAKQAARGTCPFKSADDHWAWWLDRDASAPTGEDDCPLFAGMIDEEDAA